MDLFFKIMFMGLAFLVMLGLFLSPFMLAALEQRDKKRKYYND